jgi:TRAP-type C4-dicarboxylate transport system permease small subunit
MTHWTELLERMTERVMALMLIVIVALIFSNVVGRYALGASFAGAEELSRLLFVWLVFLGAILALRRGAHLGMTLVQARLSTSARKTCAIVSHLLSLYVMGLFVQGSWVQTQIGLTTYSTVLHFPNALVSLAGVVCAISMCLVLSINLWRIVRDDPRAQIAGQPAIASTHEEINAGAKA